MNDIPHDAPLEPLRRLAADQVGRYPRMAVQDWYKLARQTTLGGAHAGLDLAQVLAGIEAEWVELGRPLVQDRLIEPIDPWGEVLRVNLRIYRGCGGRPEELARDFVAAWTDYPGDAKRLAWLGTALSDLSREGAIAVPAEEIEAYWATQAEKGYPALSHSKVYRSQYRPAYRILRRGFWNGVAGAGPTAQR